MWTVLKLTVVSLIVCGALEVHSEDLTCHVCKKCGDATEWTSELCPHPAARNESTTLKAVASVKQLQAQAATDPSYHCFRISRRDPENGTLIFERGCIEVAYDAGACDLLAQDGELASCKVCGRPLCNVAASLFPVSVLLTIGGLLMMKVM